MKRFLLSVAACAVVCPAAVAQTPPLLPEATVAALEQELSGEKAKLNLEYVARLHRTRGSRPFRAAADHIVAQAKLYGLEDAQVLEFPADGKIFYGTQRSRPGWDAEFAELWELEQIGGQWTRTTRYGSWDAMPLTLAQDSESGQATADLVDVGDGTRDSDYAGKDVRGKLVLVAQQPGAVAELAVGKYGAAGIVSYAQNQRQAWWGENENLIRWGHLETFTSTKTFAFMVSLKQARRFRERLQRGERIRLEAVVRAGAKPGVYSIGTATIPGNDMRLKDQEIVFSCHLDHPRPGSNDNASGCVTILEVARTLAKLIREKRIAPPGRTIRFVWPPEIEGTVVLLNARPDIAARIKAAVHMDMVGGGPETKAVFHVTHGPMSLPSFVFDVAEAFAEFVNEQSYEFAANGEAKYPFVAPEGGKEALQAMLSPFSSGSDHQVYMDSSWGIPSVYLNDWPDRYIHTDFDTPAMIDPTKLKRAAFIGAATGYYLAQLGGPDTQKESFSAAAELMTVIAAGQLRRAQRALGLLYESSDQSTYARAYAAYERKVLLSVNRFVPEWIDEMDATDGVLLLERIQDALGAEPQATGPVYERSPEPKGPLSVFGYDYFEDKLGAEESRKIRLLRFQGERGGGSLYAYEVLNFVDGKRTASEIRDAVAAEFGPVPQDMITEYLQALAKIQVIREVKQ